MKQFFLLPFHTQPIKVKHIGELPTEIFDSRINKQDSIRILKLGGRFYHEKYRTYQVLVGGGKKLRKQKAIVRRIG